MISVIVPVYNSEKTIKECIKSILNQTYKDYDIIIVDNNSKDSTAKIIKKYPVKYLFYDKIQSSYAARNFGIENAKGEIIAFTDADCIADKNWLKDAMKHFKDKNIVCVGGNIKSTKPTNYIEEYLAEKEALTNKKIDYFLPYPKTANAFYRKEIFNKIGLFEEWVSGGDADLCWRMQLETKYKLKLVDDCIVKHNHRSTLRSMFNQSRTWGKGNALLAKKYPDKFKKRTLKQKLWILQRIFFLSLRLIPVYFGKKPTKKEMDYISFLGWELGGLFN